MEIQIKQISNSEFNELNCHTLFEDKLTDRVFGVITNGTYIILNLLDLETEMKVKKLFLGILEIEIVCLYLYLKQGVVEVVILV